MATTAPHASDDQGSPPGPLSSFVSTQLRQEILAGRVAPGVRLFDTEIAERMGISRGPVREALRHLQGLGLVDDVPRRGVFVHSFTPEEVKELVEARIVVECGAVALAGVSGALHSETLDHALADIHQAAESGDRVATVAAESRFHVTLVSLAGNGELARLYEMLAARVQMLVMLDSVLFHEDLTSVEPLHAQLTRTLRASDVPSAQRALTEHIREPLPAIIRALVSGRAVLTADELVQADSADIGASASGSSARGR